jgi:hypothetical protein
MADHRRGALTRVLVPLIFQEKIFLAGPRKQEPVKNKRDVKYFALKRKAGQKNKFIGQIFRV